MPFGPWTYPRVVQTALTPALLVTCLSLSGTILVWSFLFQNTRERLAHAETSYRIARQDSLRYQQWQQTAHEARTLWQHVPLRQAYPELVLKLAELAKDNHVKIPGMSHSFKAIDGSPVSKAIITFRAEGDYATIRHFLYELERNRPSLFVESLDVSRSSNGEKSRNYPVAFHVRVAAFIQTNTP